MGVALYNRKMTVGDVESKLTRTITDNVNERIPLLHAGASVTREEDVNSASFMSGVLNLSNTMVGSAIMSLPFAVKTLGVIPGVVSIVAFGFLSNYSADILLRFSENGRAYTFGQLMRSAFGKTGEIIYQISIVAGCIGGCIIKLIIIADVISGSDSSGLHHSGVLEELFGEHWWTGRVFVLTFMTVFVLIPLAWRKRMDSLRHTSAVAVGTAVLFIFIVIGMTTYKIAVGKIEPPALFPTVDNLSSFWNLFTVIPVLVTAYICHFNVHTIQNELGDPSQMTGIVKFSLGVCGVIYVFLGLFGFLLFGDLTASDVLSNFDSDIGVPYSSLINIMVRLSYAVHVLLVLPVGFYAIRVNFDDLVCNSPSPLASDKWRFAVITVGLLLVILLGAIFIPNVWLVLQFMPIGVFVSFIFPASIALREYPRITAKDKILCWGLITVAVVSILATMYSNVVAFL